MLWVHVKCRLGTGWSMHTSETGSLTRSSQLTFEEQEHIMRVIRQAEHLEHTEMERIGSETSLAFSLLTTSFSARMITEEVMDKFE